jgi:hypothetical protein
MDMFHVDQEMANLLHGLSDEELHSFAGLHEDPANDVQIELFIYACFLVFTRTTSMEYLERAMQRAEGWMAMTPDDHPQLAHRSEIFDMMSAKMFVAESYQHTGIEGDLIATLMGFLDIRRGNTEDLNRVVEIADKVAAVTQPDHPDPEQVTSSPSLPTSSVEQPSTSLSAEYPLITLPKALPAQTRVPGHEETSARDICDLCNSIPFEQLPSEEDPGYPHQPSLAALEISAAKCLLCKMILEAVDEVRRSIHNEMRGIKESRYVMTYPKDKRTGVRRTVYLGQAVPHRIFGDPEVGQMSEDICSRLLLERLSQHAKYPGDVLRPWLFGNWWVRCDDLNEGFDQTRQLIGIGVRLGKTPPIHNAEGNSKEEVIYRGSGLRIRTDDGRLTLPLHVLLG